MEVRDFITVAIVQAAMFVFGIATQQVVTQHVAVLSKKLGWCYMIQQKLVALRNTAGLIPSFVLQEQHLHPTVNIGQTSQENVIRTP
jgi:hypothetical protein